MIRAGTIICACSDESATCIEMVRHWCNGFGYTPDDVKIVKREGQIVAEARRDLGDDGVVIE